MTYGFYFLNKDGDCQIGEEYANFYVSETRNITAQEYSNPDCLTSILLNKKSSYAPMLAFKPTYYGFIPVGTNKSGNLYSSINLISSENQQIDVAIFLPFYDFTESNDYGLEVYNSNGNTIYNSNNSHKPLNIINNHYIPLSSLNFDLNSGFTNTINVSSVYNYFMFYRYSYMLIHPGNTAMRQYFLGVKIIDSTTLGLDLVLASMFASQVPTFFLDIFGDGIGLLEIEI